MVPKGPWSQREGISVKGKWSQNPAPNVFIYSLPPAIIIDCYFIAGRGEITSPLCAADLGHICHPFVLQPDWALCPVHRKPSLTAECHTRLITAFHGAERGIHLQHGLLFLCTMDGVGRALQPLLTTAAQVLPLSRGVNLDMLLPHF